MKIRIDILRNEGKDNKPYLQSFEYETDNSSETIAAVLTALNERENLRDINGKPAKPVRWECNCLQKRCGACAMVINGRPQLACSVKLSECKNAVHLEPLKKFPVIADLIVDRSIMFENLKTLRLWFDKNAEISEKITETAYEASRCLQCGCCLEVCPNFSADGEFTGMASAVPMTHILAGLTGTERKKAAELYRKHIFEGCGKSLACRNICPAKIDIDSMLINSNTIAVWKSIFRKKVGESK